jgi:three-Cys-motif partner protein
MNQFGGDWTALKIEILVEYAKAYLTIMKKHSYWRTLYFDGFAGTGFIVSGKAEKPELTIGAARRIVEIDEPKSFDGYYFVEKDASNVTELRKNTQEAFPQKTIHIVEDDCNIKLSDMAEHLKKPKEQRNYDKVLSYIDPCGMQLDWESLKKLEGVGADVWILVPTGMGVNRLLKKDGNISDKWIDRLERFLGLSEHEIKDFFFREEVELTLFGEETRITKIEKAVQRVAELYQNRLNDVFKFVTDPYALRNEKNSIMYHLIFVSNNSAALNIATDILNKYKQQ